MIGKSLALMVADVSRKGLLAITVILCARLLTTTIFGEYMFLISLYQVFSVLAGAGVPFICIREVAVNGWDRGGRVLGSIGVRAVYSVVACALAFSFIRLVHYPPSLLFAVPLMLILMVLRGTTDNIMAIFQGFNKQWRCVQIAVVQSAVTLAVTLAICLTDPGVNLLFGAHIVGALMSSITGLFLLWLDHHSILSPWHTIIERSRELLRDSNWMNAGTFVSSTYNRCDVLILRRFWPAAVVGIYSAPYRLFDITQILPTAVMGVLLPRLCNARSESKVVDTTDTLRLLLLIAMLIVIGVTLFSPVVLPFVIGEKYRQSVPLMQLLVWAVLPMYWNILVNSRLIAHRAERFLTLSAVVALLINIGLNLIVIPRFGAMGAAVTTVITECALLSVNLFSLSRIEPWQLPRANGRIAASVIAIAVFSFLWCTAETPRFATLMILGVGILFAPVRRQDLLRFGLLTKMGR